MFIPVVLQECPSTAPWLVKLQPLYHVVRGTLSLSILKFSSMDFCSTILVAYLTIRNLAESRGDSQRTLVSPREKGVVNDKGRNDGVGMEWPGWVPYDR